MIASETALAPWTVATALRCALGVAGVLVFFTGLDNYAAAFWSGPQPLQLVLAFIGGAAGVVLLDLRAPLPLLRSPVLLWIGAFFLITTAWAVFTLSTPFDSPALRTHYRSLGFLGALAVIFDDPRARRIGAVAIAAAVVFASALNVAELFGVVSFAGQDDVRVGGRAAGLYVNPNLAAFAIVFGLAVAIQSMPRALRVPLLVVGATGVAATFSRGAGVCLLGLIPLLVWRGQVGARAAAVGAVLVAAVLIARGESTLLVLDGQGILTADTSARLRLEQDDSGRVGLARGAWQMFLDAPFAGNGVGATVQAHNEFLTLAGDHGVVGLLLFPALALALAAGNPAAVPFALVLLLAGFFSHNLLDNRASLLAIAFAAARAVGGARAPAAARAPADAALGGGAAS